jgi:hypothetical protein
LAKLRFFPMPPVIVMCPLIRYSEDQRVLIFRVIKHYVVFSDQTL